VGFFITVKGVEVLVGVAPEALEGLTGAARELAILEAKARLLAKVSMPAGIFSGLFAGLLYNRYKDIQLAESLAFFGGRRFVPIVAGFACLGLALVLGLGWSVIETGLDVFSRMVFSMGKLGLFVYGLANRLLVITGLHHILNNVAWFLLGDYNGVTGDLKRFFAGDPTAGAMMTGYFPVIMFGLPAACLAMYHAAHPHKRAMVGGMLMSMAMTCFLTGVTEPIEFAFMFLAPALYVVHSILTGLSLVIMDAMNVRIGFGFSAGLFDYVLSYGKATNPIWMIPVGGLYGATYYGVFRFAIHRFNLKTLGREDEGPQTPANVHALNPLTRPRGQAYVHALGGAANIRQVDCCTTRLRLVVADNARVDEATLKQLGAKGVIHPAQGSVQVVIGPTVERVADEIRDLLRSPPPTEEPLLT
ncbi:MAG: PTS transporter subunit EIIC, partial [Cystobacter sp.]